MTDELIMQEANRRAVELAAAEARRVHVTEFATRLAPSVDMTARRLASILLSMPTEAQAQVEQLLTVAQGKLVDFSSHGHSKILNVIKPPLPDEWKHLAWTYVKETGKTAREWLAANPEVGRVDEFDLSEFEVK